METLNNHHYNARRILILGTTGQGKTTAALRLIRLLPASLVLIYDWQGGEISRRLGHEACADREAVGEKIAQGARIVAYDPGDELSEDAQEEDFAWWCDMCRTVAGGIPGRKLVVIDESQDLMTTQKIPAPLYKLLARGRRREIDTILIAAAANAIHGRGRNQVNEVYCFNCIDDNALEYPASLGLDREQIMSLQSGEFFHRDKTGKLSKLDLFKKKNKQRA